MSKPYAAVRGAGRVTELFGSSTARGGANVLVQTVLVLVITGMLAWLSMRHPVHWDWTEAQTHSLSQGTLDVLAAIPEDGQVEVYAFYTRGAEGPASIWRPLGDRLERAAAELARRLGRRG